MTPAKLIAWLPGALAAYVIGWWGINEATGLAGQLLPFLWILAYFGIFWGGWLAIPMLGVGATFLQPFLPKPARPHVRRAFVAWLLAWLGVLIGLVWLGAPQGFEQVPL